MVGVDDQFDMMSGVITWTMWMVSGLEINERNAPCDELIYSFLKIPNEGVLIHDRFHLACSHTLRYQVLGAYAFIASQPWCKVPASPYYENTPRPTNHQLEFPRECTLESR